MALGSEIKEESGSSDPTEDSGTESTTEVSSEDPQTVVSEDKGLEGTLGTIEGFTTSCKVPTVYES